MKTLSLPNSIWFKRIIRVTPCTTDTLYDFFPTHFIVFGQIDFHLNTFSDRRSQTYAREWCAVKKLKKKKNQQTNKSL